MKKFNIEKRKVKEQNTLKSKLKKADKFKMQHQLYAY